MVVARRSEKGVSSVFMMRCAAFIVCLCILCMSADAHSLVWDMDPPKITNDPLWEEVNALWANHQGGKNLDALVTKLNVLKEKNPDRVEPYLWLARVHYLHARYHRRERDYHFDKSEMYAARACKMDPKHPLGVMMLVDTLFHSRDREYIFSKYGYLIRSFAPLPIGDALPDMSDYEGWGEFKQLWEARGDVEKAKLSLPMIEKMAGDHPNNHMAQTWASRANYYVGEYYTCTSRHKKGIPYYEKGIKFSKDALALKPDSVPANYWFTINCGRKIQFKWIFMKLPYLMTLMTPLLYCDREDSLYYFGGPILIFTHTITAGGWVAEKGMEMAGVNVDMSVNALEVAEILMPDYFYIPYLRAEILSHLGKKKESLLILEELLARDPGMNPQIPENRQFQAVAKTLYSEIKRGKS